MMLSLAVSLHGKNWAGERETDTVERESMQTVTAEYQTRERQNIRKDCRIDMVLTLIGFK
jgi:hypothetical protein